MLAHSSANRTARHDVGSGGRGAGIPGIGPNSSTLSHSNTSGGYASSNSSYNNKYGRGSNIPSGPRAGAPQPRPPPKAVDPSAMEVLGLLPPERPPPPSRSDGPPGYLESSNRGSNHSAPRHQAQQQQQQQRPPQQQPGASYGGQSSGVSTSFARAGLHCANMYIFFFNSQDPRSQRKKEKKRNKGGADPFLPKKPHRPA